MPNVRFSGIPRPKTLPAVCVVTGRTDRIAWYPVTLKVPTDEAETIANILPVGIPSEALSRKSITLVLPFNAKAHAAYVRGRAIFMMSLGASFLIMMVGLLLAVVYFAKWSVESVVVMGTVVACMPPTLAYVLFVHRRSGPRLVAFADGGEVEIWIQSEDAANAIAKHLATGAAESGAKRRRSRERRAGEINESDRDEDA